MVGVVPLLALVAFICIAFYGWARAQGLVEPERVRPGDAGRGRVSLVTEALAYVGAILVLAGGGVAFAQRWDDLGAWAHVGVFAGTAVLFLVVGGAGYRVRAASVQRLVSLTWALSVAALGTAVGVAAYEVYDVADGNGAFWIGLATAVYAAVLWLVRRRALQSGMLFGGVVLTAVGVVLLVDASPPLLAPALVLWLLGIGWAWLGWLRYVEPLWVSFPLGVVLALVAPGLGVVEHGWIYAVGITTAAVVMALSVPLHNPPLLGLGAVGMFGYVTGTVVRYFGDTLGVPAALAVTGLVILVLAVVAARLARMTRSTPPEVPQAEPDRTEHDLPRAS